MPKEELYRELHALKKQVADLQSRPQQEVDPKISEEAGEQKADEEASTVDQFPNLKDLQPHFEELLGSLEQDLKDIPAMAAVAIFGLGILFGRLLSR